jgi:hypothetical protein
VLAQKGKERKMFISIIQTLILFAPLLPPTSQANDSYEETESLCIPCPKNSSF